MFPLPGVLYFSPSLPSIILPLADCYSCTRGLEWKTTLLYSVPLLQSLLLTVSAGCFWPLTPCFQIHPPEALSPASHTHIARLLHSSLPEQVSKASSLNSVSTSLIPTTIRGVSPERMTLAKGSGGPDTRERESRPQDEGKESLVQEPWCADWLESSGPREQEEQGSQTRVSPGEMEWTYYKLDSIPGKSWLS